MAREFAKPFYDSKEWKKVREYCLMRDRYMCVKCGNADNTLEVHHIIHLSPNNIGDVSITLNPENLITLCRDCHFAEHKADKKEGIRKPAVMNIFLTVTDILCLYQVLREHDFEPNRTIWLGVGPPLAKMPYIVWRPSGWPFIELTGKVYGFLENLGRLQSNKGEYA